MILCVTDQEERPARPPRAESREAAALRAVKADHPELSEAVDMHLELVELFRRVQGGSRSVAGDQRRGRQAPYGGSTSAPAFEDIPLELTDLRLLVGKRPTSSAATVRSRTPITSACRRWAAT